MGFIKVIKNKAYFRRYQVKFKRRRECKTDYYARKKLIVQDKNKYKTPKYRLVVRFTNRDVVAQLFSTDMDHDVCLAAAYSHELSRYGVKVGLTNWAAAYATGLLLARRVNVKFGLEYEGVEEADGEDFTVEQDDSEKAPFKAFLDVGLVRTSTGARVFAVMKGACDGGLNVPHNTRRLPGSYKSDGNWNDNPEIVRKYIFGGHVSDYMTSLKEDNEEEYAIRFKRFIDAGVGPDDLEDMYAKCHAAIRADPNKARDPKELGMFKTRSKAKAKEFPKKRWNAARRSIKQRKDRIRQKLTAMGKTSLVNEL